MINCEARLFLKNIQPFILLSLGFVGEMLAQFELLKNTVKDNRQTQVLFACRDCGYTKNADMLGAISVLKRAQVILAT